MIHVDGQTVVVMESVTDRMRLKDKIVTNVAKAIKSVRLKNWYHYHTSYFHFDESAACLC